MMITTENISNIWKILEEFNFEKCTSLPKWLTCKNCGKILKNPCKVSCGCNFCLKCIENMIASGLHSCIGNSEECQHSIISNFIINYKKMKKISKVFVKCPAEKCSKELQLISMDEHLRHCSKITVNCVFFEFGCNQIDIERGEMSKHLLLDQENHNRLILETIDSLKKYFIETVVKKNMDNERHIELLKEHLKKKDEEIKSIKESIKLIKKENEDIRNLTETLVEIRTRSEIQMKQRKSSKVRNGNLEEALKIEEYKIGSDDDNNNFNTTLKERGETSNFATIGRIDKAETEMLELKLPSVKYEWLIDGIKHRVKNNLTRSDRFQGDTDAYKMRLKLLNTRKYLGFSFRIYPNDARTSSSLLWPFKATVTVNISNKARPGVCREITKMCILIKHLVFYYSEESDLFLFNVNDLHQEQLLDNDCCVVQFLVYLERPWKALPPKYFFHIFSNRPPYNFL